MKMPWSLLACVLWMLISISSAQLWGSITGAAASAAKTLNPVQQNNGNNNVRGAISSVGDKVAKGYNATTDTVKDIGNKTADTANAGFKGAGQAIGKEVSAVETPIAQTLTTIGSSQCSNVKKLFGVDYVQLSGVKEPDLNQLKLVFRTSQVNLSYSLVDAPALLASSKDFNPRLKLVLFMHGFTDNPLSNNFGAVSDAFLNIGQYTTLGLDSSSLIRWLYLRSTSYIRFIGERLGEVLAKLVQEKGLNPEAIHLVGHSLGAHISGFAGKAFFERTGRRVGRITGLDPAGPCFSHVEPDLRLKSTDADFVDAIHTDIGVYGLTDLVGHVDFFPNGGSHQPSCVLQTCSHGRAVELFAESIARPKAFPGLQCESWNQFRENKCSQKMGIMGNACPPDTRGQFYMQTGEETPYGLEKGGLRFINNEGIVRNIGTGIQNTLG